MLNYSGQMSNYLKFSTLIVQNTGVSLNKWILIDQLSTVFSLNCIQKEYLLKEEGKIEINQTLFTIPAMSYNYVSLIWLVIAYDS